MQTLKLSLLLIISSLALYSCDENSLFEKDVDFKNHEWLSTDTLSFTVDITTTAATNVYVNIRHRFNFNWRNVWLNMDIYAPNDSLYQTPLNIPLSQPDGQWYGDCSGDICRLQYPLTDFTNYHFPDTGQYIILLSHDMREDPLLEMMSCGIRIERYTLEE